MRLIRKPQIERDQKKIRSGYAAGYKKGIEEAQVMLDNMRSMYEQEIRALRAELEVARANAAIAEPNVYVDQNTGNAYYYRITNSPSTSNYLVYTTV